MALSDYMYDGIYTKDEFMFLEGKVAVQLTLPSKHGLNLARGYLARLFNMYHTTSVHSDREKFSEGARFAAGNLLNIYAHRIKNAEHGITE